jgi:hypothetical protein
MTTLLSVVLLPLAAFVSLATLRGRCDDCGCWLALRRRYWQAMVGEADLRLCECCAHGGIRVLGRKPR